MTSISSFWTLNDLIAVILLLAVMVFILAPDKEDAESIHDDDQSNFPDAN